MAEVSINIGANTQEANAQINQLNQSLGKTGAAADAATKETEQLEATLKRQEANIKIIDGAVNLLGGSVELLAGALVLSGAASEEQAKEFEAAALGAIAFADGAKRTVDGVKSLNEGLASYGGIAGAASKAQAALNKAVIANPYVAVAAAVVALGVGLAALYNAQVDAEEASKSGANALEAQAKETERLKNETDALRQALSSYQATLGKGVGIADRELKLLQAQGASEEQLRQARKKAVNERISDLNRQLGFVGGNAELEREVNEKLKDAQNELNVIDAEYNTKKRERATQRREQEQKDFDKFLEEQRKRKVEFDEETKELKRNLDKRAQDRKEAEEKEAEDRRKVQNQIILDGIAFAQKRKNDEETANKKIESNFVLRLKNSSSALNDFFESEAGQAIGQGLAIASNFTSLLLQAQDDSTEESFEASKKYKIAQVVTSAAQSAFEAFASAQKLNGVVPGLGTAVGIALVGAITLASKKAISDIQSSQFSGGTPSVSTPSAGGGGTAVLPTSPSFGAGGFLGQPQGTLTPITSPQTPLRAYVVSADVTNGQQANAQITRRRTLGPG
jgi:hypothetical protein